MAASDEISESILSLACPTPIGRHERVLLAHGGGGRMTHQLIEQLIMPAFRNELLEQRHDGAVFEVAGARLAMTTDSYVVRPLFFPGGDIGSLAVNGTVNDLAMCGARPLHLSVGLIIEEGLPLETLARIVRSMRRAADEAGVTLVTGDTKVVERGKADGLFVNTSGIGLIDHSLTIAPDQVRTGDAILVSGDLGRHGIAIMATREGLEFESVIGSDTAQLATVVRSLIAAGVEIHCLRDLTRGGLASALVEIAEVSRRQISLTDSAIPIREAVRGACEMLGLDPLHLASEGRLVAFVPAAAAQSALDLLREAPGGETAAVIGQVHDAGGPGVITRTSIGTTRVVEMLSGEQLPRIC